MKKAAVKSHRSSLKIGFFFLLAMTIATVCFMSGVLLTKAGGPSAEKAPEKKYLSYEVKAGDTLWDLASEYNDFSLQDSGAYVEEVRSMNHLSGDPIHAGAYIVLPYYE